MVYEIDSERILKAHIHIHHTWRRLDASVSLGQQRARGQASIRKARAEIVILLP